jgi:hypothetical protein
MNEKQFLAEHKKYGDIELTDNESAKLKGMPYPGATVNIFWTHWENDTFDVGYLFLLPFSDSDIDDYFIHIPRPENPGGKDTAHPEWIHINKLLKNEYCKNIIIQENSN